MCVLCCAVRSPNGAIIHYKPEPATCRVLRQNEVFLLDSGAQYRDGTTGMCCSLPCSAALQCVL